MSDKTDQRVVVTGLGAVSPWGWSCDALWRGLQSAQTRITTFDRFDASTHRTRLAGQVPAAPPELASVFDLWNEISFADRFALAAAREAMAAAGYGAGLGARHAGVFFASSTGGMLEGEKAFAGVSGLGSEPWSLRQLTSHEYNGPGDAVSRAFAIRGPVETVSSACASGGLSIAAAFEAVRSGEVEVALTGGSDELCQLTYAGFNALRAVDERPCRPFRGDRAGMSLGEGAAVLVLEPLDAATARGATILAELRGTGASCDAHHMTAPKPDGEGAAEAIREALDEAQITAEEVDFVNAHGTGTPQNDIAEWNALRAVFGSRASDLPLTSVKGAIGHLLGSAGAIEAVATILCLVEGEAHPTAGDGEVDAALPAALVRQPLVDRELHCGLSLSLAFGGANAALVFTRTAVEAPRDGGDHR